MKKDVTIVPKDKFLLDILAEMGEQTKNTWIFLHRDLVDSLWESAHRTPRSGYINNFIWTTAEGNISLKIDVSYQVLEDKDYHVEWIEVYEIISNNIAFKHKPKNPDEILFFKMEE